MHYQLFRVAITAMNASGDRHLNNPHLNTRIARYAVTMTGVIAAVWTQNHVELLLCAADADAAESMAEYAASTARFGVKLRVLSGHDFSYLRGLARQCAELTDAVDTAPDTTEALGIPHMVWSPAVRFHDDGLTADGVLDAMAGAF